MDIRIQRALDGELAREDLTRDEAIQLAEAEALILRVVRAVPAEPLPDLSQGVLDRLPPRAPLPAHPPYTRKTPLDIIRGAISWFWQPRPISLAWRPAYAFGAVAVLATVLVLRGVPTASTESPVTAAGQVTQQVFIQFRLDAPQAQQVSLAGDFTAWKPMYNLTRSDAGIWTIVVPMNPGVHEYAFIVDGERWLADPAAPAVEDGFGGMNSRLAVLSPDVRTL
ncbi:MAG: glycogen-binding domain-containing protein [Gemmatimonadota bacterium]